MERKFRRILIVDDDLTQLPLWKHILGRSLMDTTIEWAVSSEQAEEIIESAQARNETFDLIVVDLFLAGSATGLDFLQSKAVENTGADTILVSAANKNNLEEHVKSRLKNTKVIAKPLNLVKCEKVINQLIG